MSGKSIKQIKDEVDSKIDCDTKRRILKDLKNKTKPVSK